MTRALLSAALIGMLAASALPALAQDAACYADYKARQDDPLRLHYGTIQIQDGCPEDLADTAQVAAEVEGRLAAEGWTLLDVVSLFDETGLAERQGEAGDYHLRF